MRNPLDKSFFDGVDDAFEMRLIDTPIGAGLMGLEQVQALAKALVGYREGELNSLDG